MPMRIVRTVKVIGWGLLVLAIPFVIFDSGARPSLHRLGVGIGIGLLMGAAGGLVFRLFVPLERRLRFFRSLSPRMARRLMPSVSAPQKQNADNGPSKLDS